MDVTSIRFNRARRRLLVWGLVCAAPLLSRAGDGSRSLDEVIARLIEARGGARAWEAISTMEIAGSMTTWSKKAPFTLKRARDGRYLLDSVQGDRIVRVVHDGRTAWWENHWVQGFPQRIRGADLAAIQREVDFPNPLFAWREKGYDVTLLPAVSFEGRPAIGLRVGRPDGLPEIWYLDPGTFLEIGRESPGSNFGEPVPMTTYYDDFRPVGGVLMPYRVEQHWHSRESVIEVESIRINPPLDDAAFTMPPTPGMEVLDPLVGRWKVLISERFHPGAPWREAAGTSTIEKLLGGGLLQERYTTLFGHEGLRSFSFDRLARRYRVSTINEATTLMDVKEGAFDDRHRLVLSNAGTGTAPRQMGATLIERLTLSDLSPGGFLLEREISTDGGAGWFLAGLATYTRDESPPAESTRPHN